MCVCVRACVCVCVFFLVIEIERELLQRWTRMKIRASGGVSNLKNKFYYCYVVHSSHFLFCAVLSCGQ